MLHRLHLLLLCMSAPQLRRHPLPLRSLHLLSLLQKLRLRLRRRLLLLLRPRQHLLPLRRHLRHRQFQLLLRHQHVA